MSFFQVQVDENLTISPLWMGGEGQRMTCNKCHAAIDKVNHTRKLCQSCYEKWELTRVKAWKRWARRSFQRRRRRPSE